MSQSEGRDQNFSFLRGYIGSMKQERAVIKESLVHMDKNIRAMEARLAKLEKKYSK